MVRRSLLTVLIALSSAFVFGQQRAEWAPNEVIVKFPAQGAIGYVYSSMALGAREVGRLNDGPTMRMHLPKKVSLTQAMAIYKAMGAEYAEPNYILHAVYSPNDSYYRA
jgi:hypothetical protein